MIMKKLLLLLLIANFVFAQPGIEIRLVNANIGTANYSWNGFNYISMNSSNDAGLNAIFSTYNVTEGYENNEVHPYPPYFAKIKIIRGTYPAQMIADLQAYSTVVASAKITNNYEFSDALRMQLVDLNIGSPVGTSGNIIVTNDAGLNTIFLDFNVFYYVQSYPSSSVNSTLRYYTAVCDCDKNLLNTALLNYSSVVERTEIVNGGAMLSNPQFEKTKALISPNPFSDNFNIETEQTITNYTIVDINGKTIISTSSKSELDNQSSQLTTGIYILTLDFDNGQKANYKLVKK
jgi:hypothetical protein